MNVADTAIFMDPSLWPEDILFVGGAIREFPPTCLLVYVCYNVEAARSSEVAALKEELANENAEKEELRKLKDGQQQCCSTAAMTPVGSHHDRISDLCDNEGAILVEGRKMAQLNHSSTGKLMIDLMCCQFSRYEMETSTMY